MVRTFSNLLIFCAILAVWGQQQDYVVESFPIGTRSIPAAGNTIIEPVSGDTLFRIEEPTELNPGELLLRRRFGPNDYGLFLGKQRKDAFPGLSAFMPPVGFSAQNFIYRKLYMQETENPNMDMTNVYFDNELIFVENAAKIYFWETGWKMIPLLKQSDLLLTITSFPDSATVIIDGVELGTTPLTLGDLRASFAIITVRKEGYYQNESFVSLDKGGKITRRFILPKMIASTVGAYVNPYAYTFENRESVDELDKQIERLKQKIERQKEINEKSVTEFENEYPPFPSQGEFEKTDDFLKRKELYEQEKKDGKIALKAKSSPKVLTLENELMTLVKYRTEIENRLYHRYFSTNVIHMYRYEPDLEYFPVDIRVNDGGHNFAFSGILQLPLSVAPDFKKNLQQGRLKLTYRGRIFKPEQEGMKTRILYEYTRLSILFRGSEYPLEGKCSFPGRSENTEAVASMPKDSLNKKPGEQ